MIAPLVAVLCAIQAPLDQGTFVIREDTVELGRETFQLTTFRSGTAAEYRWRLADRARYTRLRPVVVLAPALEVSSDSQPLSLDFEVSDPRAPSRIRGERSRDRLTIRYLGRRTESAREVPIRGPTVVLDDSVFALYGFAAWHAGPRIVDVTAIVPRAGRREVISIEDLGPRPTTLNGAPATRRHVRLTGGVNQVVHLWLDGDGRIDKVEIPSRHLHVERLSPA